MTEEVFITIKGLHVQLDDEQDEIEVVNAGHYKKIGDVHYISYEEPVEGTEEKIQNLIRLKEDGVEVTKKGVTNMHMSFVKDKKNLTYYDTPYGSLLLGIAATSIAVKEEEDVIDVGIRYALDINYEHMADANLSMHIISKNQDKISLS